MLCELACPGLGLLCAGATCIARRAASMVAWLSCPMDSGKCSFPAMLETQCGSGHWLPTTELGWQGALGTARGEPAIPAPNGAMWLEGGHCGASVGDRGLQTALWHGCLGKVCLSLVSLTAW